MGKRLKVTWAEFEQIPCNRCGACCEKLWLPSPAKLAELANAPIPEPSPPPEWLEEKRRFAAWVAALEPTGQVHEAASDGYSHQYRCSRFIREADGAGFCTAYEDRPSACRGFPYGKPVRGEDFGDCSYNVDIVSANSLWRRVRRLTGLDKSS
ncbi:MAG: YkgJ family cysteine cluster protein [Dehalococcoidia bacterium]